MQCPICTSAEVFSNRELYDDRYGYNKQFLLKKCRKCDHQFLAASFTDEDLTDLYTNYYPRSSLKLEDYMPYKESSSFITWLNGLRCSAYRWVPRNVSVLDIGCGFGQTLGYHLARGCDAYGCEVDENIRRVADKFGYKVNVGTFNPDWYENECFSYITLDQVLEHVSDPIEVMKGVAKILKPEGTVILSIPNAEGWGVKIFGRRWSHWHTPYHQHFYSRDSLHILAKSAGLRIEKAITVTNSEWLYYQWVHLLFYPKIGIPSAFWSSKNARNPIQLLVIALLRVIHFTKINHIITRICDAAGIGDNLVVLLRKA